MNLPTASCGVSLGQDVPPQVIYPRSKLRGILAKRVKDKFKDFDIREISAIKQMSPTVELVKYSYKVRSIAAGMTPQRL
jgi:hypothetical protein